MHICIQPAVVIQYGKFGIPGIAGKPFLFIPETQVIQLQRILKQLLRPRPSGKDGGRCRQNHKCMGVALLVGKYLPVGSKPRIPSAVFLIMKLALKPLQPGIRQSFASGMAQEAAQAVYMDHTARYPGFTVPVRPRRTVIPQVIGASSR